MFLISIPLDFEIYFLEILVVDLGRSFWDP